MVKVRNEQGLKSKNKMICFPYAGGCASFYGKWKNEMNEIEICPIQLPGREESFRDEKIYDMETAVEQVLEKKDKFPVPALFTGSENDNCIKAEWVRETAKGLGCDCIIYEKLCHDMMLDPAAVEVAGDILQFVEKVKGKEIENHGEARTVC